MTLTPTHPDSSVSAGKSSENQGFTKKLRLLIPVGLLAIAAGFGIYQWFSGSVRDDIIELSGRIEGYETDLGAKVGGRVASVAVREGERVRRGQVIAQLDDAELQAQLDAARARVAAAQQQVNQAQVQIDVLASQITEAELTLQQAQGDTAGRVNQAEAAVATAQAQLAEARAQAQEAAATLELARSDRNRFADLVTEGAIPQQQFDEIQTRFNSAQELLSARQAAVTAAQQQVTAAEGALTQARTSQLNPDIRAAQVSRTQMQQEQAQAQLAVAQAELEQAQAAEAELLAKLDDLAITSPIDGVVVTRTVEPGEVISVGTTVLTVVNLEEVYLRGYIPEGEVGNVRVGQPAQVFLDSAPNEPLEATVSAVDTEASFTPENIYFRDDRVTQVFGLKLSIENPGGFAKPGMPADGEILLDDGSNESEAS